LKKRKENVGDPMIHIGIMTLNSSIPYRRPVMKGTPVYVNAKGIMKEIEQKHGGLYSIRNDNLIDNNEESKEIKRFENVSPEKMMRV
jgi:hypothetical protein